MNPKRILIIQLRRVGDVIFTLPVIGALRKNFPEAQIDFLTENPSDQIVALHPGLSETLLYESDRPLHWIRKIWAKKYDWVLDFHANGRTLFLTFFSGAKVRAGFEGPISRSLVYTHRVRTTDMKYLTEQKLDILRALGVSCGGWNWDLKIPRQEAAWADNFLRQSGFKPGESLVGMAPATRRSIRAWKEERFAETAERLLGQSHKILFLWGPGELNLIESIRARLKNWNPDHIIVPPEVSLLKLAALIQCCNAVLAVDNGPKNIAVALDVPTLTLSGPTNPLSFNPSGDPRHLVLRDAALSCISCGLMRCPVEHQCMDHLTSAQAFEGLMDLLTPAKSNAV